MGKEKLDLLQGTLDMLILPFLIGIETLQKEIDHEKDP